MELINMAPPHAFKNRLSWPGRRRICAMANCMKKPPVLGKCIRKNGLNSPVDYQKKTNSRNFSASHVTALTIYVLIRRVNKKRLDVDIYLGENLSLDFYF